MTPFKMQFLVSGVKQLDILDAKYYIIIFLFT